MPKRVKTMADIFPDDAVKVDPFNTIPYKWKGKGFKVAGFIPRSKPNIINTMIMVLFDGARKGQVYSTTWTYLYVLNQYSQWLETIPWNKKMLALGHDPAIVKEIAKSFKQLKIED